MNLLRQIGSLVAAAALLLILWAVAANLPKFRRVMPDAGYRDLHGLPTDETIGVDGTIGVTGLRRGDIIAYRTDQADDENIAFGRVLGLPGETITVSDGTAAVDGRPWDGSSVPHGLGDVPGMAVPEHHGYVMSDGHQLDSTRLGPIPGSFLLGLVKDY